MSSDQTKQRWQDLSERTGDSRDHGEFLPGVDEAPDDVLRRDFLRIMGASIAMAGVSACSSRPSSPEIVPYVVQPPEVTPGVASFYATTMGRDGYGVGVVVESHEGRPTKVEGNADHPASLGAAGAFEQASTLGLYDPSRARGIRKGKAPADWEDLVDELTTAHANDRGRGLHLLLEPTSSPLLADQITRIARRFPEAAFHYYAPLSQSTAWEGARIALGRPLETQIDLRAADVILALDSDFLGVGKNALRDGRFFADRRRVNSAADTMNRLYVAEAALSVTGMTADHRLRLRTRDVAGLAAALLAALNVTELAALPLQWRALGDPYRRFVDAVARDLQAHRGRSVVRVGDGQPAAVHAMAHAMNAALGSVGSVVQYTESPIVDAGQATHDLAPLAFALGAGSVETLVILGTNAAYTAPADFELQKRIARARRSVYLGLYENETARACQWFVPSTHDLESWGDSRAMDGTVSLQQPLIAPLYDGRSGSELLSALLGEIGKDPRTLLRDFWSAEKPRDFDVWWPRALSRGVMDGTAYPPVAAPMAWGSLKQALGALTFATPDPALEITFHLDSRVFDGRYANNAWLLELPCPVTKQTWGNAAQISVATAARLGLETGDIVEVKLAGRALETPVLIVPGHADDAISLQLGYGRDGAEVLARGVGANAYVLRSAAAPYFAMGATLTKRHKKSPLAITQTHHALEGRDEEILHHLTLAAYQALPPEKDRRPLPLYQLRPNAARQWGMTIDLNTCTGCSACVVACQSENNIPIVGARGVLKGREMHWLRIDRYFVGEPEAPLAVVQPMLCQHCEMAPCEYVCPVNATNHSADGLNQMIYNRCVGTRFCSNNCPYKVRRFNWFEYHQDISKTETLVMNPNVTVRARGVMEKCSFCVQRIRGAEIRSAVEGHPLQDGDVQTACQQACPTRAITFGDLADKSSRVAQTRSNNRGFAVLEDLATVPRVRYLARLTNLNPELQ